VKAGKLEFVSIYGEIGDEDRAFFTMLDEALPPDTPFPRVFLNSYGGDLDAEFGIGRILRKHQATAESGSPVIPDSTLQCSSACALVAHGVARTKVLISGTRKGVTPVLAKLLRRRSAIEPEIGHMKSDGRLARCPLKGTIGDAIFAVLCGCGHNIRKILARIRVILTVILAYWLATHCAKFHSTNVQITA
jgi:hypothetical protein